MTQTSLAPALKSPLETPLLCVCGSSLGVLTCAYGQVQSLGLPSARITNPGTSIVLHISLRREAALFPLLPFLPSTVRKIWKQWCWEILCVWSPNMCSQGWAGHRFK